MAAQLMSMFGMSKPVGPLKLYYFPIAGRGELIKLIAACGKLELVEGGAELTAEQKLAFGSPGSVPVLEHGDFKLAQSNAIECYVAGLVPKFAALSAQQKATDQMFALIKEDMWLAVLESKIPASGFVLGLAYPTVADLAVYNICTGYMPFGGCYKLASYDVAAKFPNVAALAALVKAHECLKDYTSSTEAVAAFGL
ncbi:GTPase [Aureococcus anophagefferens]|nr:GTPase [Aureococcus anophagefferens]